MSCQPICEKQKIAIKSRALESLCAAGPNLRGATVLRLRIRNAEHRSALQKNGFRIPL